MKQIGCWVWDCHARSHPHSNPGGGIVEPGTKERFATGPFTLAQANAQENPHERRYGSPAPSSSAVMAADVAITPQKMKKVTE